MVIGSGPGGYVAALRAARLGMKTAVVERSDIGGVCLNWGCIPTKTLLKSAEVLLTARHAADYGITVGEVGFDLAEIVARSRKVAENMRKGIAYLFKKNGVEVIPGNAYIKAPGEVQAGGEVLRAENIIIATGAQAVSPSFARLDGRHIFSYRQALVPDALPRSLAVIGSGPIGSEFAFFYRCIGCEVTIIEFLDAVVPAEDWEVSAQLNRSFRKMGIRVLLESFVQQVDVANGSCVLKVQTKKGMESIEAEKVLVAVGIMPNTRNLGLEDLGIELKKNRIPVDIHYRTSVPGIYAIGDVIDTPALAHVASAEALHCVETLAGIPAPPVDYDNFPVCIYTMPEIASCGLSEQVARSRGLDIKVGKLPFTASSKAMAAGARDGFVKLIIDAQTDKVLGVHCIGEHVTEMIGPLVAARSLGLKAEDLIHAIFPHPTMSENIREAAAVSHGEAIHI